MIGGMVRLVFGCLLGLLLYLRSDWYPTKRNGRDSDGIMGLWFAFRFDWLRKISERAA